VTSSPTRIEPAKFAARRKEIESIEAAARERTGHESLGEGAWRDLAHPARDSVGFLVPGRAYVHVARADNGDPDSWSASVTEDREPGSDAALRPLLGRAISADDTVFADLGFRPRGTLFEMRAPFPIAGTPSWPAGVSLRPFEPGTDDDAWLAVNNRAFAGHPDQGGWRASTLQERMAEHWFDPSLFLLAVDDDGIAGFNWLKQHDARPPDPALGEIYVIGVDPRAQGSGLGRALAIAGLHAVAARGSAAGLLYCAADNSGALALYQSLGFSVHRTDRAYVREVSEG
jgi:ribosomal protein S18 acetylase RimI-like enzyme